MAQPGRNKLLLERLPIWATFMLFLAFIVMILATVTLVGIYGPALYQTPTVKAPYGKADFELLLSGNSTVDALLSDISPLNYEMIFFLRFFPLEEVANVTGFSEDIELEINIFVPDGSGSGTFTSLSTPNQKHTRSIHCPQHYMNANRRACSAVQLFHAPFLNHDTYRVSVRFLNQEHQAKLFQHYLEFDFVYVNKDYSLLEILYRYIFLGITIIVTLAYVSVNRLRQQFKYWHEEQYWILVLLLGLVLYNNPFYALQFYSGVWLFTLFNIMVRVSFLLLLLLWLLVFTHGMYTRKEDRTFVAFYLPKLVLIAALWMVSMFTFIYSTFQSFQDPGFSMHNEIKYYRLIQATAVGLTIAYLFMLLYYILRMFGLYDMLSSKFTFKFKLVWGMTVFVIVVSAITLMGLKTLGLLTSLIIFFSFQVIFNMYIYLLALLFLASAEPDTVRSLDDVPLVDDH